MDESFHDLITVVEHEMEDCPLGALSLYPLPRAEQEQELEHAFESLSLCADHLIQHNDTFAAIIDPNSIQIRLTRKEDGLFMAGDLETSLQRYHVEFARQNGIVFRAYPFVYDTYDHTYTNENEYDVELGPHGKVRMKVQANGQMSWFYTLKECIDHYMWTERDDPFYRAPFTASTVMRAVDLWNHNLLDLWEEDNEEYDEEYFQRFNEQPSGYDNDGWLTNEYHDALMEQMFQS